MNFIVLVKQVPDISHIPEEAWDREKGTLRRQVLDAVFNPLDLQALTLACRMRGEDQAGRIVCLTMGPNQAKELLEDCLSRGADEAVLLTDMKFAGADTAATAYALACAIRKIVRDIFQDQAYVIVAGMQSVDGDTAQVPAQVAEELGMEHIACARAFERVPEGWQIKRIGPQGLETLLPARYPFLMTVIQGMDPLRRSFHRARAAGEAAIRVWGAEAVGADQERIGFKGSRTWVTQIFGVSGQRAKPCAYLQNIEALLDGIEVGFARGVVREAGMEVPYVLGEKVPSRRGEIWVYVEVDHGTLAAVTLELLTKAKELAAALKEKVAAVMVGHDVRGLIPELFAAGADKVYLAEHPLLKDFLPIPFKKTISAMLLQYHPQVMLFGATPLGRDLAPRVAYAVGAGLTADCTGLAIEDHDKGGHKQVAVLKQTRPALGGNIMATIITKDSPYQMASVRPGVFQRPLLDGTRRGEVVVAQPVFDERDLGTRIVAVEPACAKAHLEKAGIIVAAGRGMGSRVSVEKYLVPFAEALSLWLKVPVELAGSRMAVEDGFIDHGRQVGQTGQTVSPRLYVAVGISGTVQHITGMQNSGSIVAINKDPQARIYHYADYGIVADFEDAMPRLIEAIHRRVAAGSALRRAA